MPKPSTIASSEWIQQSFRVRWILLVPVQARFGSRQLRQDRRSVPLPTYRSELASRILIDLEEWRDVP